MAQKHTVTTHCDMCDMVGAETEKFAAGGTAYEIDLCGTHREMMDDAFAPFVAHGRKTGSAGPAKKARRTAANRQRSAQIRAWAQEHGREVGDRGRIPVDVVEAYERAQRAA